MAVLPRDSAGRLLPAALAGAFLLAPVPADARVSLASGSFGTGFAGPVLGLVHLLGLLAIGLWAGQQGGRPAWQMPVAALVALFAAGLAAQAGIDLPYGAQGLAGSLIVLGILIALAPKVPPVAAVVVAAVAGVFQGYSLAGGGGRPLAQAALFWSGILAGGLLATTSGVGLVQVAAQGLSPRAVTALGAGIAVDGLLILLGVW